MPHQTLLHAVPVIGVEEVCEGGSGGVLEGQQRQGLLQLTQVLPLSSTHTRETGLQVTQDASIRHDLR
jgi:hypothetical protein